MRSLRLSLLLGLTPLMVLGISLPLEALPGQPWAQSRGKRSRGKTHVLTPYLGGFGSAKTLAQERNVPLLIHMILEGEPENDSYRNSVLPHQGIIEACQNAVVIIANNGEHKPKTIKERIEGREVESQVCSSYPWFQNCAQHRAPWDDLYMAYQEEDGELKLPQTILLNPAGKKAWRKADGNPAEAKTVLAMLEREQKAAGPGLTSKQLSQVKKAEKDAKRSSDGKLWASAWREWNSILEITESGLYADKAKAAMPKIEAEMERILKDLKSNLVPGSAAGVYSTLYTLQSEWRDTPAQAGVVRAMKSAEKDKAIKDEIREWRFEREALDLLEEAVAARDAKNDKDMKKALRKLFGKKYASTKAQAEARKEFPELAPKDG